VQRHFLKWNRGVILGITAGAAVGLTSLGFATSSTFASASAKLPTAISGSRHRPGPALRPRLGRRPMVGGLVVTANTTTLSVRSINDVTRSYTLNSSTRYLEGTTATDSQALMAGERVHVVTSPGSTTAKTVRILEPRAMGMIVGISNSGNTITITGRSGLERVIDTSGSTSYHEGRSTVHQSALKVGELISASGKPTSNQTSLDATNIAIHLPRYAGKVTAINGDVLTLQLRSGVTATINVTRTTTYRDGTTTSNLAAVKDGSFVVAQGVVTGTNTMTATRLQLGRPSAPVPPGKTAPATSSGPIAPA